MTTIFKPGDEVVWQTPEDLNHWEHEYRRLSRRYGTGPFLVIAASQFNLRRSPRQDVMLEIGDGATTVPSSWIKLKPLSK